MPQLIPVALALAASYAATATGVAAVIGAAIGASAAFVAGAIGTIVAIGASYAMSAMGAFTSKPKAARPTNTGTAEDRKQIIRGSAEARQVIYGYARVGGAIVYAASSGDNLRYLHLVVVVATHQVAAIPVLFLNSQAILDSDCDGAGNLTRSDHPMVGRVRIEKYLGTQTTGSSTLAAESPDGWSSTHALRGCAYVYIRLEYDQEKMPGLQTIEAEVRGKADIADPRSGSSGFTSNWALCVLDYLRSPFGLACADEEIDFSSFITAANLSDENVQIAADGTTQTRFLCDGSFKLDRAPIDIMEALLSAGSGALCYVAGQYRLYGGAYTTPTASLGISDFAGELEVTPRASRRELFNGVRGTFIDPERGYQASEFGAVFDSSYDAQDGGERVWRDLEFAFTNNNIRAQRLARTLLVRARQSLRIKAPVKFSALRFCVWQMLYVTHPDLGLSAKPMRVIGWEYEPNTGVVMVELQAEAASAYAWVYDYAYNQPAAPDTTLIDPLALPTPAPPSLAATTILADDGAIVPAIAITWAEVNHAFVTAMEVQWRVNAGVWNTALVPAGTTLFYVRPAVVGGAYEARIRATSQFGRSAWSSLSPPVWGAADATVPSAPTGISSVGGIRMIRVLWNAVTTRDMDRYRVYERLNSGSGWYIAAEPYSTDFVRAGLQPGEAREFQVSAVDRSGNEGPKSAVTGASASLLIAADITQGIIDTAKFAAGIEPVSLVAAAPTIKSTNTVFNTSDGKVYRWNGTAYTAAIPAVDVSGTLSSAQIASLDAAKLSGTMDVARIASGALDDTKLQGGTSANQIWNSTGANGLTGWSTGATDAGSTKGAVLGAAAGNWQLTGFGSAYMTKASQAAGQTFDLYWQSANKVPVIANAKYEFQARFLPRNTSAHLRIAFYTSAGAYISETGGTPVPASAVTDGKTLDRYTKTWMIVTAPTGAALALLVFRVGSGAAETNPTLIWTQALFAEARPNQTSPSVWSPGAFSDGDPAFFGAGSITASLIATDTITAAQIASNAITANELAANSITTDKLSAGSVTASKLVIQPNNLNQDPLFKDVAYWSNQFAPTGGSSTGWYRDSAATATANGVGGLLSLWSGAGFTSTAIARVQTAAIAYGIRPASKYTHRFRAQNSTANQNLYVAIDWFDASGTYLSSATTTVAASTTIRSFVNAQISPPASAYGYRLSAQNQGGVAFSGSMSVGAIEFLMLADADLIVDGAVVASKIGAGEVTAGKLAAGSVVTSNLAVGSSNLIWNSTFSNGDTTGWGGWAQTGDATVRANLDANATLRGFGTGYMHPTAGVLANGQVFTGNWVPSGGNLPVLPGQKYQASALVMAIRCTARVDILWYNASNGYLSESNSATVSNYSPGYATEEANYARLTVLGAAPTGAAYAVMRVFGLGTGGSDPYLFWTKAMFGQAPANATEVGIWEPGGVTQISGGQLVTRSISADRIATNAITANELAANSVVAGKIAASAISSNQIAAGEIKAVNLAADTLITSAAQVGTAVIGSAQIADLNVTRLKTANGAITGAVSQSQYNNVTLYPPLPNQGWGNFGYNIAVLAYLDITIDYRDNGLVVVFPDSNTLQIEDIVYIDYANSGGGAGGSDGGDGGGGGSE